MARPKQAKSPRSSSPTAAEAQIPGTMGHGAPVDTTGMTAEEKIMFGINQPSPTTVRKSMPIPRISGPTPREAGMPDPVGFMKRLVTGIGRHLNSTGSQRSPSTVMDRGKKGAPADTMSQAEEDRLSKKYLGR